MGDEKPFYDIAEFPLLKELQDNYQVILEEFKNAPLWVDWGSDYRGENDQCLFLDGEWKVCPVYFGSTNPFSMNLPNMDIEQKKELFFKLPDIFPKTISLLKKNDRIKFAAFSRLYPKSRLEPHAHSNPYALIFHLGIIIPPGNSCGLKVGDETHTWTKAGDAVIFNDNLEHSAWNDSDTDRIVLYLNFSYNTLADRVYGRLDRGT